MERTIAVAGRVVHWGAMLALLTALSPAAQTSPSIKPTTTAPPATGLPPIEALLKNYPRTSDAELKKTIGGAVIADWITNTNTIRMSRAFNYSGAPIPAGPANSVAGLHTVMGGDKQHYAYRVAEFASWLRVKYGQPTLSFKAGPYGTAPAALSGKPGIIQFMDCGWSDASGHIDLWDGQKVVGKGHFEICKQIHLWEPKAGVAQATKTGKVTAATNIRSGPSTSAPIVGQLQKDAVVTITGAMQGNFYPVGNSQWVSAAYVKLQ